MWAVLEAVAGHPAICASASLAREPGYAIVGVIAAPIGANAAVDAQLAGIRWVAAVLVVAAGAATGDEAARKILAARGEAHFTGGAGVVLVAEVVLVGTAGTKDAGFAPGTASIGEASIQTRVRAAIGHTAVGHTAVGNTAVGNLAVGKQLPTVHARVIDGRRVGGRFTATGRSRSGQHEVSKEAHGKGDGPGRCGPKYESEGSADQS